MAAAVLVAMLAMAASGCSTTVQVSTPATPPVDVTTMSTVQLRDEFFTMLRADPRGADLDESCLRTGIARYPDADLRLIVAAGVDGDPHVSQAAALVTDEIRTCLLATIDWRGAFVDELMRSRAFEHPLDRACVEQAVRAVQGDGPEALSDPQLAVALTACTTPAQGA